MYRAIRTARMRAGKAEAARVWARAIAELVNRNHPGHAAEASVEIFGTTDTLVWTATHPSLAEYEAFIEEMASDDAYQALVAKSADYLVEGSTHLIFARSLMGPPDRRERP